MPKQALNTLNPNALTPAFAIHVIWFIRVFSKYPVLGTLNYFDEIQYWKPLKNP